MKAVLVFGYLILEQVVYSHLLFKFPGFLLEWATDSSIMILSY